MAKSKESILKEEFGEEAPQVESLFFLENREGSVNFQQQYETLSQELEAKKQEVESLNQQLIKLRTSSGDADKQASQVIELASKLEVANQRVTELENAPPVVPDIAFVSFEELDSIVGCTSKYAERKKQDLFNEDYAGKWVNFTASISKIEESTIYFKNADGVKLEVGLIQPGSGYDLLVGDELNITFTINKLGSCDTPYIGSDGKF